MPDDVAQFYITSSSEKTGCSKNGWLFIKFARDSAESFAKVGRKRASICHNMAQYDRRPSAGEETIRPRKNIAAKINFHVESEQEWNDDVHADEGAARPPNSRLFAAHWLWDL